MKKYTVEEVKDLMREIATFRQTNHSKDLEGVLNLASKNYMGTEEVIEEVERQLRYYIFTNEISLV